jgi:hypothetical protein
VKNEKEDLKMKLGCSIAWEAEKVFTRKWESYSWYQTKVEWIGGFCEQEELLNTDD